jgi:hypothetical protein
MRDSEILCHRCVYPWPLNYLSSHAGPPAYVRGDIADHRLTCTHCGEAIERGRGFVYVLGERPIPGEEALHRRFGGEAGAPRQAA